MTGIDPTNRLAALLGVQAAAIRERVNAKSPGPTSKDYLVRQKGQNSRDVASLAAQRAQAIDPDDPKRLRKAFRIFLEAALVAELGDHLINDPAFHSMVDDVHKQMEEDPELSIALEDAARLLLRATTP